MREEEARSPLFVTTSASYLSSIFFQVSSFKNYKIDLQGMLETVAGLEIHGLMVEGGAGIITGFLSARLVDQIILTISPLIEGELQAIELPIAQEESAAPLPLGFAKTINMKWERGATDPVVRGSLIREEK